MPPPEERDEHVIDVPLAFYEWLATIEKDVRARDLTPPEIAGLIRSLRTTPSNASGAVVDEIEGLFAQCREDAALGHPWHEGTLRALVIAALKSTPSPITPDPEIERAVEAEREACAKVADARSAKLEETNAVKPQAQLRQRADEALFLAAAIRSRTPSDPINAERGDGE